MPSRKKSGSMLSAGEVGFDSSVGNRIINCYALLWTIAAANVSHQNKHGETQRLGESLKQYLAAGGKDTGLNEKVVRGIPIKTSWRCQSKLAVGLPRYVKGSDGQHDISTLSLKTEGRRDATRDDLWCHWKKNLTVLSRGVSSEQILKELESVWYVPAGEQQGYVSSQVIQHFEAMKKFNCDSKDHRPSVDLQLVSNPLEHMNRLAKDMEKATDKYKVMMIHHSLGQAEELLKAILIGGHNAEIYIANPRATWQGIELQKRVFVVLSRRVEEALDSVILDAEKKMAKHRDSNVDVLYYNSISSVRATYFECQEDITKSFLVMGYYVMNSITNKFEFGHDDNESLFDLRVDYDHPDFDDLVDFVHDSAVSLVGSKVKRIDGAAMPEDNGCLALTIRKGKILYEDDLLERSMERYFPDRKSRRPEEP